MKLIQSNRYILYIGTTLRLIIYSKKLVWRRLFWRQYRNSMEESLLLNAFFTVVKISKMWIIFWNSFHWKHYTIIFKKHNLHIKINFPNQSKLFKVRLEHQIIYRKTFGSSFDIYRYPTVTNRKQINFGKVFRQSLLLNSEYSGHLGNFKVVLSCSGAKNIVQWTLHNWLSCNLLKLW